MSSFGKDKLDSCLFGYIKAKYQALDLSELKRTRTKKILVKSDETVKYEKNNFKCPKYQTSSEKS